MKERTADQMLQDARRSGAYIPGESQGSYGDTLKCNPPHVHVFGSKLTCCCGAEENTRLKGLMKAGADFLQWCKEHPEIGEAFSKGIIQNGPNWYEAMRLK